MSLRHFTFAALALGLLQTSVFAQRSIEEKIEQLEARIKEVEKERDALKQKVASLMLENMKLKEAGGAVKPAAPAADGTEPAAEAPEKPNQIKAKYVSKTVIEANAIEKRIWDQNRLIDGLEFDLSRAKSQVNSGEFTARNFIKPGEKTGLQAKRAEVTKLELQLRNERAKLKELQQEAAESGQKYNVTFEEVGTGKIITLLAKGALVPTVDTMEVGKVYQIEGRKRGVDIMLMTKVAAAQ